MVCSNSGAIRGDRGSLTVVIWISGTKFVLVHDPVRDWLPEKHGKSRVYVRGCVKWFIGSCDSVGRKYIQSVK